LLRWILSDDLAQNDLEVIKWIIGSLWNIKATVLEIGVNEGLFVLNESILVNVFNIEIVTSEFILKLG
jgi:hypothetical protein